MLGSSVAVSSVGYNVRPLDDSSVSYYWTRVEHTSACVSDVLFLGSTGRARLHCCRVGQPKSQLRLFPPGELVVSSAYNLIT